MTHEELLEIVRALEARINILEENLLALRKWSDVNDRYNEECINALTDSVDKNFDNINENIKHIKENAERIEQVMRNCRHYNHIGE